jgi:O-antigen/teichoic acid export membrane protein
VTTVDRTRFLPLWLRSWAADSAALLFSQAAAIVATSALAILLARHLGPIDWGIFSGFLALSMGLSVFVEFGLTQWLLRELSRVWTQRQRGSAASRLGRRGGRIVVASFAVNLALATAMVIGAAAVAAALQLTTSSAILVVALVAYGGLLALCSGLEAVFRARRALARVVTAILLEKGLLLVLVGLALVFELGLMAIGIAYVFAVIARVIFDVTAIIRSGDVVIERPSIRLARYVTHESIPFALNRASLNIVPRFDTFLLAALSPLAAGYFALGDRVLGPIIIVPVVMSAALYPFLAQESSGSRAGWRIVCLLGAAGGAIAVIGIGLAPRLVPFVVGPEYEPAVPVVQMMFVAIPFIFAANPLLAHLYTARLEHRGLGIRLAGVSCLGTGAVVIGQILIGPVGAAAGFTGRMMLFLATLVVASKRPGATEGFASSREGIAHSGEPRDPGARSPASSAGRVA